MSESNNNNKDASKKRGPSIKRLKTMDYLEILEHYTEYPQKNLKFNCVQGKVTNASDIAAATNLGKKVTGANFENTVDKVKFLSEKDKAEGWVQNYSTNRRFSKFFMTNLHFLPEHLWSKLTPFYHENVLVGYKARDRNVHFFVHEAEVDNLSRELYEEIRIPYRADKEKVKNLVEQFERKDIDDCWLTMRAKSLVTA